MRKLLIGVFVIALSFTCLSTLAVAQSQFGTVNGRVADPNGAVVPDAKVTLKNQATGVNQSVQTNGEGLYVIGNVAAGDYDVTVEKQNFRKSVRHMTVLVAQRATADFTLELGSVSETVEVTGETVAVNTVSGELSSEISTKQVINMPLATRDPYELIGLSAGAQNTGHTSGDTRGEGIAVNGARTSSLNFMLDGGENNNTFDASVGQKVPLDAIQEFRVQTNSTTAEFGRNAINANVITKSGTNAFHGSAYEYYRGGALSTDTYNAKATDSPKPTFVRNNFGFSAGGPIIKDKTFFFGSFEGLRVRSAASSNFYLPTATFMADAAAPVTNFINGFGGPPASNCGRSAITADELLASDGGITTTGNTFLTDKNGNVIPGTAQLFCLGTFQQATDAGAGAPENTWLFTGRVDHHFSDKTALLTRYAFQNENDFAGFVSFSPYGNDFNTGQDLRNQQFTAQLTHAFSPRWFNEARFSWNRFKTIQPLGAAPATTPCFQYNNFTSLGTGDPIVFPGYSPVVCSFAGIPFGGPQNIYQFADNVTVSHGKHTIKFGASYLHLLDERVFGAYENAYELAADTQSTLDGSTDLMIAAIDPRGHVPGDTYDTAVDGPFIFPNFGRHFHYNEFATYAEDSLKVTPRVTLTLGLRWEYFGVLHSPDRERLLDSNLYLDAVGQSVSQNPNKSVYEQIRDARFQRTSQFYNPQYNDFGPRVGLAWDITGNGRTVFRAGYGYYYDRNFGNAVFNAIQNPPSYMTVTLFGDRIGGTEHYTLANNQFDTLAAGGALTLTSSARMLDRQLSTAYSSQWNATLEHDLFGKGIITSLSYVGSNGYKLYSLSNLNPRGSCLLEPNANGAGSCNPDSSRFSRLNQSGLTGMNRRGNDGLSRYNGLNAEVRTRQIAKTGLALNGTYTWSHSIDNESSFFADSPFEGDFGFGFKNAFDPGADRASSSNDSRHRGTISGTWEIPWAKGYHGIAGQVLDGWTFNGIFQAQTGGAFSIYESSGSAVCPNDGTNFCYPVITGAVPSMHVSPVAGVPNSFNLYNVSNTFEDQAAGVFPGFCPVDPAPQPLGPPGTDQFGCTAYLNILHPGLLSPRNLFRTPGFYNIDFSVLKDFRLPREGMKLQFRAEFFNLLNHSNLYVRGGSNSFNPDPSQPSVIGVRGIVPGGGIPDERRNIQLALRLVW
jgi:hypothetical protein